ncbi:uncharacterized protein A4U43_C03F24300 [Asparagus officinalis]|uniref:Uncharacterized protein n=1 Tax=Asparagus officinalis TaxID=4686 RepID=A0A5P1FDK2_ASPOF|nr:uncharacterized protein A4U43_C03F24300 [Asparagus officinalis]
MPEERRRRLRREVGLRPEVRGRSRAPGGSDGGEVAGADEAAGSGRRRGLRRRAGRRRRRRRGGESGGRLSAHDSRWSEAGRGGIVGNHREYPLQTQRAEYNIEATVSMPA